MGEFVLSIIIRTRFTTFRVDSPPETLLRFDVKLLGIVFCCGQASILPDIFNTLGFLVISNRKSLFYSLNFRMIAQKWLSVTFKTLIFMIALR